MCIKLFHGPTWPYKSIINVHICPIHFCVSCTLFLCLVCVGRTKGTHQGIYTLGWGPVFLALSGIAISSFSPGSLCQKPLLHCRFIQCRLFFFFLLQCHTQLVETCEMWRKNCIHLHGIHLSIKEMKCVPYWVKNRAFKEGILNVVWRHHVMSYIAIGQETQISIYDHKRSISFCKAILMKNTSVQEHCTEKL